MMKNTQILSDKEIGEIRDSAIESIIEAERRITQRFTFSAVQSMAPYNGSQLPRKTSFSKVLCQNISTSSICFLLPHQPDFDHAVIALGTPPRLIYVAARVTNVRPAIRGFFVGCSFLSKVTIEA